MTYNVLMATLKPILMSILTVPTRRSTIGDRAFPVTEWQWHVSAIERQDCFVIELNAFRDDLKTILFKASFELPDKGTCH